MSEEEERQRQMDFIVSWQAQFAADLQKMREEQRADMEAQRERWRKADEKWAETANGIRALLAIAEIHEREIMENGRQINALREAGRETDERLNVLVDTVERIISEGRNGGPLKG